MSGSKNFAVSFRNDNSGINSIMNSDIRINIMDIMIAIDSCEDFEAANKQKIPYIQDFIYKNTNVVDYMIMLYGNDLIMRQYNERFGEIVYSPILTIDFATLIIDNIIVVHECKQDLLDIAFIETSSDSSEESAMVSSAESVIGVEEQCLSPTFSWISSISSINSLDRSQSIVSDFSLSSL